MLQRKCPKCENGIMSDMYTARGWGREGFYACDSCSHVKNIYEEKSFTPFLFFILFEVAIFFFSSNITLVGYFLYGVIFVLLVYLAFRAKVHDEELQRDYPIIGEFKGEFKPTKIQEKSLENYMSKALKTGRVIKILIALFIFVSYSVMFYFEDNLDYMDYIGYGVIALVLPMWLVITKFKGE